MRTAPRFLAVSFPLFRSRNPGFGAELARVTVWIGDIQWCRQNGYPHAINPILKPLDGIEHRDALLNPDGSEATWPVADVVVGNPPFLGDKVMRSELGAEYVETLRKTYDGRVPGGASVAGRFWACFSGGSKQSAGISGAWTSLSTKRRMPRFTSPRSIMCWST